MREWRMTENDGREGGLEEGNVPAEEEAVAVAG